jgi:acyl-CoA synthetase (AMP-forming)/AMP-acid ligase II
MIRRYRITGVAGVPLLWQQLTHPRSPFLHETFPSLRYITNSGGAMPEGIVRSIRGAHPSVEIFLMYGLTEAFRSTYLPPEQVDCRPTSIGKAIPETEIMVINQEGQPCQAGEIGELVHKGPTVSLGYWNQPEETSCVFRPDQRPPSAGGTGEVVVFSGDLVRKDEEGYLYFVGRRKEQMKSRGIRVSPEEIEHVVHRSGSVVHAVAFAVPKDAVDSRIVVAVVPHAPESFDARELMSFCRKEMPEYMRPETIWPWEKFPTTPSGKPDRIRIRAVFLEAGGQD